MSIVCECDRGSSITLITRVPNVARAYDPSISDPPEKSLDVDASQSPRAGLWASCTVLGCWLYTCPASSARNHCNRVHLYLGASSLLDVCGDQICLTHGHAS
jgi:hypothetical protein